MRCVTSIASCDSNPPPPAGLTLATTALPDAVVGQPYSATLSWSGATGAVTVTSAPDTHNGVTVNSDGSVTGTPSAAQDSSFDVSGTDEAGVKGTGTATLHSA